MMNKRSGGFSLIELMIVVSILAIVVAWGYSSYRDTVLKSRRAEGLGELLVLADEMERFYSSQGTYIGATLGTSASSVHALNSENGYYGFGITSATAVQFTITAAPQGGQADDGKCGTFTLTSLGVKSTDGSLPTNKCWK